ncbi:hypothetical protein LTR36_003841 [Oleoguttula mirabilis]|uniref:BTB domain-containing protein n=1 Tax=Oleoguttula mirabilis TaxID=1507867 RepID=A0AAV9JI48_9PEZI|nr:hypothetical protein LTR36_003841 [Oleoguttula mirabilis]
MAEGTEHDDDIRSLASSLQSERLIEIYVGAITPNSKPYLVPQTILEAASEYFVNALRSDSFREGRDSRLHFPYDNVRAWEVLLFWMYKDTVPSTACTGGTLVSCWVLGDKYAIPNFQDSAMLLLLDFCRLSLLDPQALSEGIASSVPGSKMRRLIAEELVVIHFKEGDMDHVEVEAVIDGTGLLGEFLAAHERLNKDKGVFSDRLTKLSPSAAKKPASDRRAIWRDYLVGELPAKHWIYEREGS